LATNNVEMMRRPHAVERINVVISVQAGMITVDPDIFEVHKHLDEEVRWTCTEGDGEFLVEFSDSPFYEAQFSKDAPVSGLARRSILANRNKIYKYTVTVGDMVLDPGGVIRK
jgi:hypothetical protein